MRNQRRLLRVKDHMRIDREAFLVAVAALAGCDQGLPTPPPPPAAIKIQPPSIAAQLPKLPDFVPMPESPPPVAVEQPTHHRSQKRWFRGLSTAARQNVTAFCAMRAENQCQAALLTRMPKRVADADEGSAAADPAAEPEVIAVAKLPHDKVEAFCKEDFTPPSCETPLVVAFDSQPIEFAPAGRAQFAFVPGAPAATDWPTAVTPWIAIDLDGDGRITSGAELFGSSTVLPGGDRATNGFLALGALDANGDGALDARDPMFAALVLWSDRNGDHRSSADELRPLSSVVTRISLAYTREARCNERDDCEGERGTLHWRDAAGAEHVGAVIDVYIPRP